jgi:hypothetical protein
LYAKQKWLPVQFRPAIPFIIAGFLGLVLPQVLGSGHELVVSITKDNIMIKVLILLLVVKFIFSMISFGCGAPGGIFFPLLVIGALIGAIYGKVLISVFHFNSDYMTNFIILGMAGYFTAIVRAPITGCILITEMTGSFSHLLSLSIVSIVSYVVADLLKSDPIYESLLERILHKNSCSTVVGECNTKNLIEVAIHHGACLEGKKVKEFKWPGQCLLVAIKRGEKEIIPKGNTVIYAGDYLIVLTNEEAAAEVREALLVAGERCVIED